MVSIGSELLRRFGLRHSTVLICDSEASLTAVHVTAGPAAARSLRQCFDAAGKQAWHNGPPWQARTFVAIRAAVERQQFIRCSHRSVPARALESSSSCWQNFEGFWVRKLQSTKSDVQKCVVVFEKSSCELGLGRKNLVVFSGRNDESAIRFHRTQTLIHIHTVFQAFKRSNRCSCAQSQPLSTV